MLTETLDIFKKEPKIFVLPMLKSSFWRGLLMLGNDKVAVFERQFPIAIAFFEF
jgi:hypothetical protein